jgi:CheY-like chemotaxis protein
VLMDLNMPELDGYEATRHIRANLGAGSPPIIALTAAAMEQHRRACLNAGMVDHVAKPIVAAKLLDALLKWIKPVGSNLITSSALALDAEQLAKLDSWLVELEQMLLMGKFSAKATAERIERLLAGTALAGPFRPVAESARRLKSKEALAALETFRLRIPQI